MPAENKIQKVKELFVEGSYYRGVGGLFAWDQWSVPPTGTDFRGQMYAYFMAKGAELFKSTAAKELYNYFNGSDISAIDDEVDRGVVSRFLNEYAQSANVPEDVQLKYAELSMTAQNVWAEAVAKSDYELLKPYLAQMFDIKKEMAHYIDPNRPAFEVMLNMNDEGLSLSAVKREFEKLKAGIVVILDKIKKSGVNIEDGFLHKEFDKNDLMEYIRFVTQKTGYPKESGAYGFVPHPFAAPVGPKDVRITLNLSTFKGGIFGAIHEAGHATYALGARPDVDAAGLWGGVFGGLHESQSRFYENMIGRSRSYWKYFFPEAKKRFPQFADVNAEEFYQAVSKVTPSLKRIVADEVTYSLHPIIRFELEQQLVSGELSLDDLPAAWDDKYEAYLGIRPENAATGVLQDVHWPSGLIGYFQSYTLGDIYGGQFRQKLLKDVPNLYALMEQGQFDPLNNWLTENIRQYGSCYTGTELVKKVTGEELNADYFLNYLEEKYGDIYGF